MTDDALAELFEATGPVVSARIILLIEQPSANAAQQREFRRGPRSF